MVVLVSLALAAPASAATFTVNVTGDQSDGDLSDDKCDISPGTVETARTSAVSTVLRGCTLRAAIQESNQTPGPDAVHFNIPGNGVKTIAPGSNLPTLTDPVTIDGYTQPGTSPNTRGIGNGNNAVLLIELNGASAGLQTSGLRVGTGASGPCGSVIRGLVINRFGAGLHIFCDATIEGNFIGTDPRGTIARGNRGIGILVSGLAETATIIGGTSRGARNVISANGNTGVVSDRQLIVQGNHIGTKKGGVEPLGNANSGLRLSEGSKVVGGAGDRRNVIAFNHGDGIGLLRGVGSQFSRNRIFSNSQQGIDLNEDGTTPNDRLLDADTGPNNLQNFPGISSAVNTEGQTTIRGVIRSTPNEGITIEVFRNPPGEDEGQKFIGGLTLATNAEGERGFGIVTNEVAVGDNITATATDSQGNTSEFSAPPRTVTRPVTTISRSGPRKRIHKRRATFRFRSLDPGARFRCRLDEGEFEACSSPFRVRGLESGWHKFWVKAIDESGNADPTPAVWRFRVVRDVRED